MIGFSKKISENYAVELYLFHKLRSFSDGVSFFDLDISYDRDGDHTPKGHVMLVIMNFTIVEFEFYNVNHKDEDDE